MLVLVGFLISIGSVIGGFVLMGGHLAVLMQPLEVLIIGGAGVGAFVAAATKKSLKVFKQAIPKLKRTNKYDAQMYLDMLALLYTILNKVRREGMLAVEGDIDEPAESELFSQFPSITQDPVLMDFLVDYLRLMVTGNMDPFQIDALMEQEIDTFKHECEIPAHAIQTAADGLPAFGIVAAVLGVVHALSNASAGAEVLAPMIAHALVGTFLGVFLAYGFVAPFAGKLNLQADEAAKSLECLRVTLIANLNGYAPQLAVEFGRKAIYSVKRPSFSALEEHLSELK